MPLGLRWRRRRVGAGGLATASVAFDDPNGGDLALAGREPHGGVQRWVRGVGLDPLEKVIATLHALDRD